MATQGILVGPAGHALGRPAARFADARDFQDVPRTTQDGRFTVLPARGTIADNNRVMVKAGPDAPQTPLPGARVRLHRLPDGYLAWQGISDSAGYYHASGLEVGMRYVPVAIDLSGTYECVAAGPVLAVDPDA